ncbi:translocation/assembly module TamB, partial [bacterium]|nr:translocation/assembly module TamB [bacterium]
DVANGGGGASASPPAAPDDGRDAAGAGDAEARSFNPTADVRVSIPSGLWLRGQGLEVELTGDLELRTVDGRHDIGGELEAERGFYRFLGRTFQVERGAVSFDAGEELDPALDISLTTLLHGALYRVAFGGTLRKPILLLTSEPELPEGDIMAMLLFGRPLEDLSSGQEGLVQERATDLVAAFGTSQLEARLSQQLKVDMVSLRRGGATGGGDALVIGKHLHQKVLLKYEQVLDEWSSFIVNLEYFLSRHLKLETMISRHDQSAAAVNWSVEY